MWGNCPKALDEVNGTDEIQFFYMFGGFGRGNKQLLALKLRIWYHHGKEDDSNGSPRTLICQCCGMPLDDTTISREPGGAFNEDYCKWCYTDGKFAYSSVEELLAFLVPHMSNDAWPPEQVRAYLADMLPKLKHWAK